MVLANFGLALEWLAFFLLMALGLYTMRVIKNEKKSYLENAKSISFKKFKLLVPNWWGEVPSSDSNEIIFKRLDTRYDWEARFIWNEEKTNLDIIELFKEKIHARQILFDEDSSVVHNPSDFQTKDLIASNEFEMVRIEGTATAEKSERLYYDAFLIRELSTGHYLYAESKSSVLNGLVEGPYFEEVMLRLSKI
jgi:hypothetical protein